MKSWNVGELPTQNEHGISSGEENDWMASGEETVLMHCTDMKDQFALVDLCHDLPFCLSDIHFDEEAGTLELPLESADVEKGPKRKRWWGLWWERDYRPLLRRLRFHHVISYRIEDSAEIDAGMVNTIELEGDTLVIQNSVPVTLWVEISALEIFVIQTSQPLAATRTEGLLAGLVQTDRKTDVPEEDG